MRRAMLGVAQWGESPRRGARGQGPGARGQGPGGVAEAKRQLRRQLKVGVVALQAWSVAVLGEGHMLCVHAAEGGNH